MNGKEHQTAIDDDPPSLPREEIHSALRDDDIRDDDTVGADARRHRDARLCDLSARRRSARARRRPLAEGGTRTARARESQLGRGGRLEAALSLPEIERSPGDR